MRAGQHRADRTKLIGHSKALGHGCATRRPGHRRFFFFNLTPLFAALLSAAFLGELPQRYQALAFVLIVGGIVVSSRR